MLRRLILIATAISLTVGCSCIQVKPTTLPLPQAPVKPHIAFLSPRVAGADYCLLQEDVARLTEYLFEVKTYGEKVEEVKRIYSAPKP